MSKGMIIRGTIHWRPSVVSGILSKCSSIWIWAYPGKWSSLMSMQSHKVNNKDVAVSLESQLSLWLSNSKILFVHVLIYPITTSWSYTQKEQTLFLSPWNFQFGETNKDMLRSRKQNMYIFLGWNLRLCWKPNLWHAVLGIRHPECWMPTLAGGSPA